MLTGEALSSAIKDVLQGGQVRCAVAFWGEGAEMLIAPTALTDARVVCNLATGGTNPDVIQRLMDVGVCVHQHDELHAKVYIGSSRAIVASANASMNGLGLHGREQAHWLEAGALVDCTVAGAWFEQIWRVSRPIEAKDIDQARILFRNRRQSRPTQSFRSYASGATKMPLMMWVGNDEADVDLDLAEEMFGGSREVLRSRIENGVEVSGPEDRAVPRGTWCLQYATTRHLRPAPRRSVWWTCLAGPDGIAENVQTFPGSDEPNALKSVMLEIESPPPPPFVLDDRFKRVLQDVLRTPRFVDITALNWPGSFWTAERQDLIQQGWKETLRRYLIQ